MATAPVGLSVTLAVPDPTAIVATTFPLLSKVGGDVTPLIVYDGVMLPRDVIDADDPSVVMDKLPVEFRPIVAELTEGFSEIIIS